MPKLLGREHCQMNWGRAAASLAHSHFSTRRVLVLSTLTSITATSKLRSAASLSLSLPQHPMPDVLIPYHHFTDSIAPEPVDCLGLLFSISQQPPGSVSRRPQLRPFSVDQTCPLFHLDSYVCSLLLSRPSTHRDAQCMNSLSLNAPPGALRCTCC